jgi:hypothetical protein
VCDQLSDKGICSAGAFAHPAFLKEHHFENLKSEPSPSDPNHNGRQNLTRLIFSSKTLSSYLAPRTMSRSRRRVDVELLI